MCNLINSHTHIHMSVKALNWIQLFLCTSGEGLEVPLCVGRMVQSSGIKRAPRLGTDLGVSHVGLQEQVTLPGIIL